MSKSISSQVVRSNTLALRLTILYFEGEMVGPSAILPREKMSSFLASVYVFMLVWLFTTTSTSLCLTTIIIIRLTVENKLQFAGLFFKKTFMYLLFAFFYIEKLSENTHVQHPGPGPWPLLTGGLLSLSWQHSSTIYHRFRSWVNENVSKSNNGEKLVH